MSNFAHSTIYESDGGAAKVAAQELIMIETDRSGSCLFGYLSNVESLLGSSYNGITPEEALFRYGDRIFAKDDSSNVIVRPAFPEARIAPWKDQVYNADAANEKLAPYSFLVFAQTGNKSTAGKFADKIEQLKLGHVTRSEASANIMYSNRKADDDKLFVWKVDFTQFYQWVATERKRRSKPIAVAKAYIKGLKLPGAVKKPRQQKSI